MASCKVCWTCRGLFHQDVSEATVLSHLQSCSPEKNKLLHTLQPVEYFVCDKSDYKTLISLKDILRKHAQKIFSSLHVQKVLPHPLIKILLALCVSDRTIKHTKADKLSQPPALCKNVQKLTIENNGKVDKECQTILHTSNLPLESDSNDQSYSDLTEITPIEPALAECIQNKPSYVVVIDNNLQKESVDKLAKECEIVMDELHPFYVCKLCSHKSKSDQLMLRHLKSHNEGQMFVCSDCNYSTIWRKEWKNHLQRHRNKIQLTLSASDRPIKHTKADKLIQPPALSKNVQKLTIDNNGKVDKECQTILHTSNLPLESDSNNACVFNDQSYSDLSEITPTEPALSECIQNKPSYVVVIDNILQKESADKLATECDIVKDEQQSFYVCKLCSHKSKSDQLMLRHLKSHNEGQMFVCSDCNYSTILRKEWKNHLQRHKNKKLQCHVCAAEFMQKEDFQMHLSSCHSISEANKLKCPECDYIPKNMASLKEHKRKHTGEVFLCPHEGCTFLSMYDRSLQKHLKQKHAQEKTEICHVCGFQTKHASSLSKHMMLHKELKPYKCSQCTFTALYPSEIILHTKRKHLKQKRFSCPTCSFQTSYAFAIQKHVLLHEGKRGYSCSVCGKGMETLQKAKQHMIKSHGYENYEILTEPSLKKVKPSDYEIPYKQDINLEGVELVVRNETVINESASKKKENSELSKAKKDAVFLSAASSNNNLETSATTEANQYSSGVSSNKGGNPMLCATAANLADVDNCMTEDSLFDLMSDFPRPPTLNRCQSTSTLMFASFSPHLNDRPLTPDFFTDSPSVCSFFPNFSSKHIETDALNLGNLSNFESSSQQLSVPQTTINHSSASLRGGNPLSPLLTSFTSSPVTGTPASISAVTLTTSPVHDGSCMDMMLPNAVLTDISQLNDCNSGNRNTQIQMEGIAFSKSKSAFTSLGQDYSPEIEAAIAGIPLSEDCRPHACLIEESPFPTNSVLKSNMFNNSLI